MSRVRLLFVMAIGLLAVAAACGNSVEEHEPGGEWPAFFSPEELIDASGAVVVATMLDEEVETIESGGEAGGERTSVTEILRTFQVEDSLKGDLQPGDLFMTFSTASVAHDPGDGSSATEVVYQVLRLEPGDRVVLFLSIVVLPDHYPDEWGRIAWAAPGEPHTARIGGAGELVWETTGRYDAAREARDIEESAGGAGPEFDMTLDELRLIAAEVNGEAPEGS